MKTTTQFDPRQEMRRPDFEIFHSQDTTCLLYTSDAADEL